MMLTLADYDIDAAHGFAPGVDPLERLPGDFEILDQVAADLSTLMRNGRIVDAVRGLGDLDVDSLTSTLERERALLLTTVLANAYVWSADRPRLRIPGPLALPLCTLADAMGRPPIVHYGCMSLRNWRRVDRSLPLSPDNAAMLASFHGGVDETWFFVSALGVELAGAPLLPLISDVVTSSTDGSDADLAEGLHSIAAAMGPVYVATDRTYEWCDPYVFYHRIRPYVAGWPEPGVVYEGISDEPRRYIGGSAAQSSLIQAMDALVSVHHPTGTTGAYLAKMRTYMPPPHRRFVEDVTAQSRVRERATCGGSDLAAAFDDVVHEIERFRGLHMRLAHDYIAVPSGMDANAKGTGGTDFGEFLRQTRADTIRTRIRRD